MKRFVKRLLIIGFFLSGLLIANGVSVEDIKMMVNRIRAPRVGVDMKQLSYTENPFITVTKDANKTTTVIFKPKRVEVNVELDGVLSNKASINGKWMKIGDMVGDYNITHIGSKGIILTRDNMNTKKLFIYKKKNHIKFQGE